ncbi:MAG TPA: class I SAM-dependent methyltransferase [Verrucomicrobiae bacterium]
MSHSQAIDGRASFCPEHFEPLFAAEDRHFWFRARNRCIAATARLIPQRNSIKDIIEHGCGTGFVLRELERIFPDARITGADLFAEGLSLARKRFGGTLVRGDLLHCGYREAFDLVGLFDVLEHLDDDLRALQVLREQLRPGGWLLMTVPAHRVLWSDYDVASGHRRRYSRSELMGRLSQAGFEVKFCTEFMFALFPLMLLRRRLSWGRKGTASTVAPSPGNLNDELHVHPLLNRLLEAILRPEPWWIEKGSRMLCGTSLLALATRKA